MSQIGRAISSRSQRTPRGILIVAAFALFSLALTPMALAKDAAKREFKTSNFTWALPSDWSFVDTSDEDKKHGMIIRALSATRHVQAEVIVNDAGGLKVDERLDEVKSAVSSMLFKKVTHRRVVETSLSGVEGKAALLQGTAGNGTPLHFRGYVIEKRGKLFHVNFHCYHGSERSLTSEIDSARRGFRLIKGAGGDDTTESLDEFPAVGADNGDDEDEGEKKDSDESAWPAKGPKREGKKVLFPKYNISWELPSDDVMKWEDPVADAEQELAEDSRIELITASGVIKRKKQEFEKEGAPDKNRCRITMYVQLAPEGRNTGEMLRSSDMQNMISRQIFGGKESKSKTSVKNTKIGNYKGTYIKMQGRLKNGRHQTFVWIETMLRGMMYTWQASFVGHTDAPKTFGKQFATLLRKNVTFNNTEEWIAGPLKGVVATFPAPRGDDYGKETLIKLAPGLDFKKPPELAQLKFGSDFANAFRFAVEGRSKDNQAYFYMDVGTKWVPTIQHEREELSDTIEKRASEWKAAAGESAEVPKVAFKKGGFGRANKGFKYKFKGMLNKHPFIEEGYAVKFKQTAYYIRIQFGGADAEKKLKSIWKSVKKGMKFRKLNDVENGKFKREIPRTG